MFVLYQILTFVVFVLCFPLYLLTAIGSDRQKQDIGQRLGRYPGLRKRDSSECLVWIHAASVGEVVAARMIIRELEQRITGVRFLLSTMTSHGKKVAEDQVSDRVECVLAPLDLGFLVDRALDTVQPDLYVCVETELWPVMLNRAARSGVRIGMVNGRISEKSFRGYKKIRGFVAEVLSNYAAMGCISDKDRQRFVALGADDNILQVLGNVKYDTSTSSENECAGARYKKLLDIEDGQEVLVAGSTHNGEEAMLLPAWKRLNDKASLLWLIAPRHLGRLAVLEKQLEDAGVEFDRFSRLQQGGERQCSVVILDCMGELASLYSVATYAFCGGSLVARGGHNIMEAALWGVPVLYGPYMQDFRDAVELLDSVQAGFCVADGNGFETQINLFRNDKQSLSQAGERSFALAKAQKGAAGRQADMLVELLGG